MNMTEDLMHNRTLINVLVRYKLQVIHQKNRTKYFFFLIIFGMHEILQM